MTSSIKQRFKDVKWDLEDYGTSCRSSKSCVSTSRSRRYSSRGLPSTTSTLTSTPGTLTALPGTLAFPWHRDFSTAREWLRPRNVRAQ